MIVSKDKVVALTYELRVGSKGGEVIESLNLDSPLVFLYGSGGLLPKFEEYIDGLKVGESFDFNLKASDAYGEVNMDAIVEVPINAFEVDGKIDESLVQIGNTIPMQDSSGRKLQGIVKEVTSDAVKMDFNHPLAGSHLFFKGEITEVREPSEDEMSHGHVHGGGGCGSGGGGCSSCGDGGGCC